MLANNPRERICQSCLSAGISSRNGIHISRINSNREFVIHHSLISYITALGLFFALIIIPSHAGACGWWGDGDSDYSDDVIQEDPSRNRLNNGGDRIDDPKIQTDMGNRYKTGKDVPKDYQMAVYWYRKAAEQGFAGAQNNLAIMYEKGLGVPKDESEAATWYRKAAEGQDANAQHSLGIMYRDGRGVPRDVTEAAQWVKRAAEQGHHGAFRDMGEMYWQGSGVVQNNLLAYMWWRLGAVHGDKECERLLSMAAVKMTSRSVKEAEMLAQERMALLSGSSSK